MRKKCVCVYAQIHAAAIHVCSFRAGHRDMQLYEDVRRAAVQRHDHFIHADRFAEYIFTCNERNEYEH